MKYLGTDGDVDYTGTDLHEYLGGPSLVPATIPHPLTGETVPLTLGHEFSGIIEQLGEGVDAKFRVGDRVCVQPVCERDSCEMGDGVLMDG